MRPRVLILDSDTTSRLALVAALRDSFQVLPHDSSQPAVRRVRAEQPVLVLVVLGRRRDLHPLRTARVLKTDARPPSVGVIDPWGKAREDELAEADGVWRGQPDSDVAGWCRQVLAGERPVIERPLRRGLLRRLLST